MPRINWKTGENLILCTLKTLYKKLSFPLRIFFSKCDQICNDLGHVRGNHENKVNNTKWESAKFLTAATVASLGEICCSIF